MIDIIRLNDKMFDSLRSNEYNKFIIFIFGKTVETLRRKTIGPLKW